jgi:hypothetical protein
MNGTFYNMSVPYNSVSFFRKYGELCYEFTENMVRETMEPLQSERMARYIL